MNIREHLIERHVNLELHRPIIQDDDESATFICWNFSGQLTGYQRYKPNGYKKLFNDPVLGRYYTYKSKIKSVSVWGLESYYNSNGPIFLTEGIFDACRLTCRNQTALATLCNSPPKDYKNWLMSLSRPIIAICDNDDAGRLLANFGDYYEIVPKSDLGDAPEDYVSFLIERYCDSFVKVH